MNKFLDRSFWWIKGLLRTLRSSSWRRINISHNLATKTTIVLMTFNCCVLTTNEATNNFPSVWNPAPVSLLKHDAYISLKCELNPVGEQRATTPNHHLHLQLWRHFSKRQGKTSLVISGERCAWTSAEEEEKEKNRSRQETMRRTAITRRPRIISQPFTNEQAWVCHEEFVFS